LPCLLFCDVDFPFGAGRARLISGDIKLGSIGEFLAEAGFKRKLRLLLEDIAAEGELEEPCHSLIVEDEFKRLSERRLLSGVGLDIMLA
jgi:hypothetical protein